MSEDSYISEATRARWVPLDENETVLKKLREEHPFWTCWFNKWQLQMMRDIYATIPPGKDSTQEEDDRMRQTSPENDLANDPDMEFLDGANGAEKYRKAHRY